MALSATEPPIEVSVMLPWLSTSKPVLTVTSVPKFRSSDRLRLACRDARGDAHEEGARQVDLGGDEDADRDVGRDGEGAAGRHGVGRRGLQLGGHQQADAQVGDRQAHAVAGGRDDRVRRIGVVDLPVRAADAREGMAIRQAEHQRAGLRGRGIVAQEERQRRHVGDRQFGHHLQHAADVEFGEADAGLDDGQAVLQGLRVGAAGADDVADARLAVDVAVAPVDERRTCREDGEVAGAERGHVERVDVQRHVVGIQREDAGRDADQAGAAHRRVDGDELAEHVRAQPRRAGDEREVGRHRDRHREVDVAHLQADRGLVGNVELVGHRIVGLVRTADAEETVQVAAAEGQRVDLRREVVGAGPEGGAGQARVDHHLGQHVAVGELDRALQVEELRDLDVGVADVELEVLRAEIREIHRRAAGHREREPEAAADRLVVGRRLERGVAFEVAAEVHVQRDVRRHHADEAQADRRHGVGVRGDGIEVGALEAERQLGLEDTDPEVDARHAEADQVAAGALRLQRLHQVAGGRIDRHVGRARADVHVDVGAGERDAVEGDAFDVAGGAVGFEVVLEVHQRGAHDRQRAEQRVERAHGVGGQPGVHLARERRAQRQVEVAGDVDRAVQVELEVGDVDRAEDLRDEVGGQLDLQVQVGEHARQPAQVRRELQARQEVGDVREIEREQDARAGQREVQRRQVEAGQARQRRHRDVRGTPRTAT